MNFGTDQKLLYRAGRANSFESELPSEGTPALVDFAHRMQHAVSQIAYSKEEHTARSPVLSTTVSLSGALLFCFEHKMNLFVSCPLQRMSVFDVRKSREATEQVAANWWNYTGGRNRRQMHRDARGEPYERFSEWGFPWRDHLLPYTRRWGPLLEEVVVPRVAFVNGKVALVRYETLARMKELQPIIRRVGDLWSQNKRELKNALHDAEGQEDTRPLLRILGPYIQAIRQADHEAAAVLLHYRVLDVGMAEEMCHRHRTAFHKHGHPSEWSRESKIPGARLR
jgi:hypothetical protein